MGKSFPKILHCLVCEDARLEQGGLLTLTGVYGIVQDFTILISSFEGYIPRLTFVFTAGPAESSFSIRLDVKDMSDKSIFASPLQELKIPMTSQKDRYNQIIVGVGNIKFPAPGKYEVQLSADGSLLYRDTFEVRLNELRASTILTSQ